MHCVEKILNKLKGITCKLSQNVEPNPELPRRSCHSASTSAGHELSSLHNLRCTQNCCDLHPWRIPSFSSIDPWRHGVTRMIALCVRVCVCVCARARARVCVRVCVCSGGPASRKLSGCQCIQPHAAINTPRHKEFNKVAGCVLSCKGTFLCAADSNFPCYNVKYRCLLQFNVCVKELTFTQRPR
jgi:hypothetical protein